MSEAITEEVTKRFSISISDRVSIINSLMAQDRIEIREKQEAVFKLTYYIVPGFIGIAVFSVGNPSFKWALVLGLILLLLLYVIAFFAFRKWLSDARACLQIRESYYKEQNLLSADPFKPTRKIEPRDRMSRFKDNVLWFPFGVTIVSAVVLLAYMLLT